LRTVLRENTLLVERKLSVPYPTWVDQQQIVVKVDALRRQQFTISNNKEPEVVIVRIIKNLLA
jgi:hypothetical protein